jgi:hypothetical protein
MEKAMAVDTRVIPRMPTIGDCSGLSIKSLQKPQQPPIEIEEVKITPPTTREIVLVRMIPEAEENPFQDEIRKCKVTIDILMKGYTQALAFDKWRLEIKLILKGTKDLDRQDELREILDQIGQEDYLGLAKWFQESALVLVGTIDKLEASASLSLIPPDRASYPNAQIGVPKEINRAKRNAAIIPPTNNKRLNHRPNKSRCRF